MLPARFPPDSELRRSSLPATVQLPSFSHFLSGVGPPAFTPSQAQLSPTSHSDPSDDNRGVVPTPTEDQPRIHPAFQPPVSFTIGHHPHYVDVRPKGALQPPALPEPYKDLREPGTMSPNTAYPYPQDPSPGRNHFQPSSPGEAAATNKRVVRETTIDGKGPCYVYDDGTICQKVINGDMVNPNWGTTKAGKPRKRLGQACNTCREKKIRCDPQVPKCAQCQKFGRECKFESSSRSSKHMSNKESMSSRDTLDEPHHERTDSSTSAEGLTDRSYSRANSRGSMNVESLLSPSSTVDASPSSEQPPSKKPRFSSSPSHRPRSPPNASPDGRPDVAEEPVKLGTKVSFAFDVDPMDVDRCLTVNYAEEFFEHVNSSIYVLFPHKLFMNWMAHCRTKSLSDKMLLYAILAAGTVFSQNEGYETHQYQFKNIAEVALDMHTGSALPAVQTRLILALLEYSLGQLEQSRVLLDSALRTASTSGLGEEIQEEQDLMFGMDLAMHLEYRRRTFWLAYISTSFHVNRFGRQQPVEHLACNLRLPCDDRFYETGEIPSMPLFKYVRGGDWDFPYSSKYGHIAFLVEVSLILNEVTAWLNTASTTLSSSEYRGTYDRIHQGIAKKLSMWERKVRDHYRITEHRTTGLHILYHFIGMLLHRHVRHDSLSRDQLERACRQTRYHAVALLEIALLIHEDGGKGIPMSAIGAGCPLAGDAITMATDVITAAGTISSLLEHQSRDLTFIELVSGGVEVLDALGAHWKTAEQQLREVKPRITAVINHTTAGTSSRKAAWFVRKPLSSPYGLACDVVYGISTVRYLQALGYGDKVKSEDDICEMGSQPPSI